MVVMVFQTSKLYRQVLDVFTWKIVILLDNVNGIQLMSVHLEVLVSLLLIVVFQTHLPVSEEVIQTIGRSILHNPFEAFRATGSNETIPALLQQAKQF